MPDCFQVGRAGVKVMASFWSTPRLAVLVKAEEGCGEGVNGSTGHIRECTNGVVGLDATSVVVGDGDTVFSVGYVGDDGIEQQS